MTILPITRRYFNQVTSDHSITFTNIPTLNIALPTNLTWIRYFEIPGIGVFNYLPGIKRLIVPSNNNSEINVEDLEHSEILVDSWDIRVINTKDIYPKNFYSRLSEIGVTEHSYIGGRFNFPEEKLVKIVNDAHGREVVVDKKEVRFVQLDVIDTLHNDKISGTIKESQEDWGGHYISFLTESDINLPLNIVESIANRLTALSIINLKYDG